MSETPQPYDAPHFPATWSDTEPAPIEAIRARVDAALHTVKQVRRQHFWTTQKIGFRYGTLHCWCGAAIETSEGRLALNVFLRDHEDCGPEGDA